MTGVRLLGTRMEMEEVGGRAGTERGAMPIFWSSQVTVGQVGGWYAVKFPPGTRAVVCVVFFFFMCRCRTSCLVWWWCGGGGGG